MEKWYIRNKQADFSVLSKEFGISEVAAKVIVNRGVSDMDAFRKFMQPRLEEQYSPYLLKDAGKAAGILLQKMSIGARIRIVGDYDVDGVASTYILNQGLLQLGAKVDYKIPDRIKDGYGINIHIIEQAVADGIDTIITCDNGIAALEQVARAKELGLTVLVTDHHDLPPELPCADALINPKQEDCTYPFSGICGAAVAYKFLQVVYAEAEGNAAVPLLAEFIPFVALATVCDVMDLMDENRIFVKNGLEMIEKSQNLGLQSLLRETGMEGKSLGAYHLGFVIGPCINASGRLDSAEEGLRMFLTPDREEADRLALKLHGLNEERKSMTERNLEQAVRLVEEGDYSGDKVLILYLPDCHESLAGIIAGRLKERYHKPALILTKACGEDGVKGSGRSIEEYNMFEELSACRDLFTKFGGHPMAAGLSMDSEEKIQRLREDLNSRTTLTDEDLIPKISFDAVLAIDKVDDKLIHDLELLAPHGKGNAKPLFVQKDIQILRAAVIGKRRNVLRLAVKPKDAVYGKEYTAMLFKGLDPLSGKDDFRIYIEEKFGKETAENLYEGGSNQVFLDMVYYPEDNVYKGYHNLQVIVESYR